MRRLVPLLFLTIAGSAAGQPSDDAVKKELKLYQGKWEAIFAQDFDRKSPTDIELQLTTLEVDGEKFTMKTGSLTITGSFSLDPSKKPKTIDVYLGDNKENVMRGIYEIKGDTRKSVFSKPGEKRPQKFTKEKGFMTLEWRQVK